MDTFTILIWQSALNLNQDVFTQILFAPVVRYHLHITKTVKFVLLLDVFHMIPMEIVTVVLRYLLYQKVYAQYQIVLMQQTTDVFSVRLTTKL